MHYIGYFKAIGIMIGLITARVGIAAFWGGSFIPDGALVFICFLSFYGSLQQSILYGVLAGMITEFFSVMPFGSNLIIFILIGSFAWVLSRKLFREGAFNAALVTLLVSLFTVPVRWFLFRSASFTIPWESVFIAGVKEACVNTLIALPLFFFFRHLLIDYIGSLTYTASWKKIV